HPHLASASTVVLESNRVSLRLDMRLEGAVVEISRSGQEYSSIDVQLSLGFRRDLDMSAAHVAFTLAPRACPGVCLRRLHGRNRRQGGAWQPSSDPDPFLRQR